MIIYIAFHQDTILPYCGIGFTKSVSMHNLFVAKHSSTYKN